MFMLIKVFIFLIFASCKTLQKSPSVTFYDMPQDLNLWYCGTDDLTKAFSVLLVGSCPREPSTFFNV